MFTLILCIVAVVWNRFAFPVIIATLGRHIVNSGNYKNSYRGEPVLFEQILVYSKIVVSLIMFLVPSTFLVMFLFVVVLDAVMLLISVVASKNGNTAFNWLFNFGNKKPVNVVETLSSNADREKKPFNYNYSGNLSNRQASGTLNGEKNWLISGSKKVYINETGAITYHDKKDDTKTLSGTSLYGNGEVSIFWFDVTSSCENFINRMPELPSYCDIDVLNTRMHGYFYFISNRGEIVSDVFKSYQRHKVSNLSSIVIVDDSRKVLCSAFEDTRIFINLNEVNDVLECKLRSDYRLDLKPVKAIDGANTLVYQFDKESFELITDSNGLSTDAEEVVEQEVNARKPDGKYNGVDAWKVEMLNNTFILENSHLIMRIKGNTLEYTCDEKIVVSGVRYYKFVWNSGDKEVVKFVNDGLSKCIENYNLTKEAILIVSRYGSVLNDLSLYTSDENFSIFDEDEEMETITIKDIRESYETGLEKLKVLKFNAEDIKRKILNKDMVYDGVYNGGQVDMLCQYGELRCCYYMEQIPVLQCLYVGKLVASYAINNIIDKISDNWQQDVSMSKVYTILADDIESLVGQRNNAIVNVWLVRNDDAYYMSLVIDLTGESVVHILQYVKQYLLEVFSTIAHIKQEDEVCYIENIIDADKSKFVADKSDSELQDDEDMREHYYKLNMLDSTPYVFNKMLSGLNESGVKDIKSVFNDIGVIFRLRNPLLAACSSDDMFLLKFFSDVNMLSNLEQEGSVSTIDLTSKITSVSKICKHIDSKLFNSSGINRTINNWRKDIFVIRARVNEGFQFSYIKLSESFLNKKKFLYNTYDVPVISLAFWSSGDVSVFDVESSEIIIYMFKKGG